MPNKMMCFEYKKKILFNRKKRAKEEVEEEINENNNRLKF